jgi:hypothetical protein
MRKLAIVISVIVLFGYNNLFAQKIVTNKIDEFEGVRIIETDWETALATIPHSVYFKFKCVGTLKGIHLGWIHPNQVHVVENGENKVLLKLKNSEIVRFSSMNNVVSSSNGVSIKIYGGSANGITIVLTSDDIDKLRTSLIEKIRITTNKSNFDFDVTEKNAKKIQAAYMLLFLETIKIK